MNDHLESIKAQLNGMIDLNFEKVKYQYCNDYIFPEFNPLRDEICKCIMLNLNQAAITLTNHLLESFLKTAIIYKDSHDRNMNSSVEIDNNYKASMDKYDNLNLEQTINASCTKGLINKEQKKVFIYFKNNIRNPYSHAEKKKIFKDDKVSGSHSTFDNGKFLMSDKQVYNVIDFPSIYGIAQFIKAKKNSYDYFSYVDLVIRETLSKIEI